MEIQAVKERVLALFKEISKIPRPSHHEEKIADYICAFAKRHGHEVYRDALHNVLVNVRATAGCKDCEPILLQGHTDMVCEKNGDSDHDFMIDGIRLIEKDGLLSADGTTLGADNGVALAIMLFVLEGGVSSHGDIQCFFTAAEETGLEGAGGFDYSRIYAKKMINMDGGEERTVIVGCAGGVRSDVAFAPRTVKTEGTLLRISVKGLAGGHSGENIADGRANANLLLSGLLCDLYAETELFLVDFHGGDKDNAIPREAVATVAVGDVETAKRGAAEAEKNIRMTLGKEDEGFTLTVTESLPAEGDVMMDGITTRRILSFLACCKNGVQEMSKTLPSLVEFSKNVGVVSADGKGAVITVHSRSAWEHQLDASVQEIDILASLCGGLPHHSARYPGWQYSETSALAERYASVMKELFDIEVERKTVHGGLECGIIKAALPSLDCISCGPDLWDLHSVRERLDLDSFGRFAFAVLRMLEA